MRENDQAEAFQTLSNYFGNGFMLKLVLMWVLECELLVVLCGLVSRGAFGGLEEEVVGLVQIGRDAS
jgi:hypothetical protein